MAGCDASTTRAASPSALAATEAGGDEDDESDPDVQRAVTIRDKYSGQLMQIPGAIPTDLEGLPVVPLVTGEFVAGLGGCGSRTDDRIPGASATGPETE
jgi:hypothetical protein